MIPSCKDLIIISLFMLLSGRAWAQSESYDLKEVESYYLDQQKSKNQLFQSVPVTHITPAFRNITYAFSLENLDDTTYGKTESDDVNEKESLHMGGYIFSPYFALSLKSIGIGIAGEFGSQRVTYEKKESYTASSESLDKSESKVDYTGIGFYLYTNPRPKWKRFRMTLLAGHKLLNVKHQSRAFYETNGVVVSEEGGSDGEPWQEFKYTVSRANVGINANILLAKRLSVIPWADYHIVNTNQIEDKLDDDQEFLFSRVKQRMTSDVQLVWHKQSEFEYGVDFATKFKKLEIHFGGFIGLLLNFTKINNENDRVNNPTSFKISVSYATKE